MIRKWVHPKVGWVEYDRDADGDLITRSDGVPWHESGFRDFATLAEFYESIGWVEVYDTKPNEFIGAPQQPICNHEYKRYLGLNETFEYCVKCDLKK